MKSLNVYSNLVPSNINSVRVVVEGLLGNLQNICGKLSDSTLFDLKVILNEVLINAIRHGNREDEGKTVRIDASIGVKNDMYIIIEDEGCGYDFVRLCKEQTSYAGAADASEISECGRGIMIVRSLCDKVTVNAKGNKIVLMKKIE